MTNRQIHFHLDQCLTQKSNIGRILNARQIGDGTPSNHPAIKILLQIASWMIRKRAKFKIQHETESKQTDKDRLETSEKEES
jgi:hypothetical protein